MKQLWKRIGEAASASLSSGEAEMVIGWQKGPFWWQSFPAFVTEPAETASLVWDPFCVSNLSKYLLQESPEKKTALFLKGCDALGLNQLLRDGRVERDRVLLFGIPCGGLVDPVKVEAAGLARGLLRVEKEQEELLFYYGEGQRKAPARDFYYDKCLGCRYPHPVIYDRMLGEPVSCRPLQPVERFAAVSRLEAVSPEERFAYWSRHFARCIRCFACRNVCPACSCRECIFDLAEPRWLGKATELGETFFYHITRAYHAAGRCVDCGECARVCPVGIPLSELNRKFIKDINELYGEYDAGADLEQEAPLLTFNSADADV